MYTLFIMQIIDAPEKMTSTSILNNNSSDQDKLGKDKNIYN